MARKDGKPGRLAQIRQTYQMTKQSDPRIGWILLGCILAPVALAVLASLLLKNWWLVPLVAPPPLHEVTSSAAVSSRPVMIRGVANRRFIDYSSLLLKVLAEV